MGNSGKRIWALVLSLAIICSMLPFGTVWATEEDSQELTRADYARADAIFDLIDEAESSPATRSTTQEQKTEAAIEVVLASDSYMEGSLEQSGNSFTWWTEDGIRCVYSPRMRKIQKECSGSGDDEIVNEPAAVRGGTPEGNQVYLVGPYYGYDSNFTNQYKNEARRVATAIGDTDGYTLYSGKAATIDKVAEAVSNGAVVFFDSHGSTDYENPRDEYDFITGATCSYLCLTSTSGLTTEDYNDGALYDSEGAFVNGQTIANHMTSDSPNGLLWMAICLGMGTDTMYRPLRNKGVEVVYGYSESVTFDGDYLYEETFWEEMNTGSTVAEAVAAMKSRWGNWDWSTQIAKYYGYNDGYATIDEAREDFCAFPVVVSDEDTFPGKRTASSYGADSLQTVQSTYSLGEVQEIVVPTDPKVILEEAYALGANESLPYEATLTGTITAVTTAYSAQYGNVTVIMEVAGCEDMPIKCYRLEGSGADRIGVGDTITVTGTIVNYQHSSGDLEVEFEQGCVLNSWVDSGSGSTEPSDPTDPSEPTGPFLPEGDVSGSYYIAAQRNDVWFYMTNDLGTASNKRYQAEDTDLTSLPASIETAEADKTFTVIANEDGTYSLCNDAGYLTWASGNTGNFTSAASEALQVTKTTNSDGTVSFHFTASDGERYLALNSTAGNNYFAWYKQTSNQIMNLELIPVGGSTTPDPEPGCQHTNTTTTTAEATCTETGSVTVVCDDCGVTVSTTVIPAAGHSDEDEDGLCDACDAELGTGDSATYVGVLMTEAPADGDEIIIGNGSNIMSDHASGTKMASETGVINGGSLDITDTMALLTVQTDEDGYYTFYSVENQGYLTSAPTGNGLSLSEKNEYSLWEVETATSGTFLIHNVNAAYNGNKNQYLECYNGNFTTYGLNDTDIYKMRLYKVTELSDDCQHTATTVTGAKDATCTVDGYTGNTVCTACGTTVAEGEVIPAAGHTMENGICSVCGAAEMVTAPEAGTAYKWGIEQNNLGKTLYFAGTMNGFYGASTEDYADGTDVYLEEAAGGYYIRFVNSEGAKQYVNIVDTGTHINFVIENEAATVYTYDTTYNTMVAAVSDVQRYIGTHGTYNTFSVSDYTRLAEGTNFPAHFYMTDATQPEGPDLEALEAAKPVVTAEAEPVTGGGILSWEEVAGATYYEVYSASSKSGTYKLLETVQEAELLVEVTPGKTRYFKIKAVYEDGDVRVSSGYSNAVKVTGKCGIPAVSAQINSENGRVVLSWEKISGAKKYDVYRATSEGGKYSKLTTTTKTTYTDSKGSVGKTYFYKVRAVASSSSYNSGYSAIISGCRVCAQPDVSVKLDSATGKPVLSWDKVSGAASYRVLRQLPGETEFVLLSQQTGTSFTDTTAPVDTQCKYTVQALGANEGLDGAASAVTVVARLARPKVTGAIDSESGKPALSWASVEGAVSYEIYRATKSSGTYKLVGTAEDVFYTDSSASVGKAYYYKVVAVGANSESAKSSYVKVTGKCAQPELAVQIKEDSGKPGLSWGKVSGAKKYAIYRATSEDGKYTKLTTTTKTSYTDKKASVGKTYFYKIRAVGSKSSYNSVYSIVVDATAVCAMPSVSVKVDSATGKPVLSWDKVSGAVQYRICRSENGGAFAELTTVTGKKFTDESAVAGVQYQYTVQAVAEDGAHNGAEAVTKIITAACAKPKLTGKRGESGKPQLTWEVAEDATGYQIYRSTKSSSGYKLIGETEGGSYIDSTAKKDKTYYYKIVAVAGDSESAKSSYVKIKSK